MKKAPPRRTTYGVGLVAGAISASVVGLLDGLLAVASVSAAQRGAGLVALMLLSCVLVMGAVGFLVGLIEEALLLRAHELEWLKGLGQWLSAGPRTWFAPDPDGSSVLATVVLMAGSFVGITFVGLYWAANRFHRHVFVALAGVLICSATLLLLSMVGVLVSGAISRFFHSSGRKISPGHLLSMLSLVLFVGVSAFWLRNQASLVFIEKKRPLLLLGWLALNFVLLVALRGRVRRAGVLVGLACVCLGGLPLASAVLNRSRLIAGVLFADNTLTGASVRGFHRVFDADRDGYSPYFGGQDCNDRNAQINPGVHEIIGNGVDENCSGADATQPRALTDGGFAPLPSALANERPSFVLLSVDAMRPDHMSLYGYRRRTTPNIDRFAREAVRFARAYTIYPSSIGSLGSLWTGRYASQEASTTLSEQLANVGYRTASFSGDSYFSRASGFYRGFSEVFEGRGIKNDGSAITHRLRNWLRVRAREQEPFFAWMHLMEPHEPYTDRSVPVDFGHELVDQYDEEIARADQILGPLLEELEAISQRRNLVVVIFADHGEGLGEHGVFSHATDLHEEALRVPLVLRGPALVGGIRNEIVSLLDLHPTVMNLANVPLAEGVSGRSLSVSLFDARESAQGTRRVFAEILPQNSYDNGSASLYEPPYKLVYSASLGTSVLYDIARDPLERQDVSAHESSRVEAMRRALFSWMDASEINRGQERAVFLGYASGIGRVFSNSVR